jgi:diadenosine tetraphosphate (Ap4A) HIT family hydrolase
MRGATTAFLFLGVCALGQTRPCDCDHATRTGFGQNECGLCVEADKAPANVPVVFIKDNDPKKPNRWLALPRTHLGPAFQTFGDLPQEARTMLWREAIARAKQMWGDRWGLGTNGYRSRGQCHLHIHIGRLIEGVEWGEFQVVDGPESIPDPGQLGMWVHPANGKLHVHVEMSGETVLAR